MPLDESTAPERRALSPEEVGARVSAILEAAERDARAVIDAAQRAVAATAEELTLEGVVTQLEALRARVSALESALGATPPAEPPARAPVEPTPEPAAPTPEPTSATPEPVATPEPEAPVDAAGALRVRAIELALSGYPRAAIARELAAVLAPAAVDALLDEVLAR